MKYELVKTDTCKSWDGRTLYRIRKIKSGELGGFIESDKNLDQSGNAWISGDAQISGNAWIWGDAQIWGDAYYLSISPIGSRQSTLTATINKNGGIDVLTGCYFGSLKDFERQVIMKHGKNEYAKEYEAAIDLIKAKLNRVKNKVKGGENGRADVCGRNAEGKDGLVKESL